MSSDEVREIEQSNGVILTDLDTRGSELITSFFTRPRIPLAGRKEGEVEYVFYDDKLTYMSYWFNTDGESSSKIADDYTATSIALITKYGEPTYSKSDGTSSDLPSDIYDRNSQIKSLGENYNIIDYNQWEITLANDTGVLIEQYLYAYKSDYSAFTSEGITYTWFDADTFSSGKYKEIDQQQLADDI